MTAYIAECHLTPAAAKKIDKVLGGYSPVYFANWLDNASHTPEYAYTKTWHYLNVDEGRTLDDMPANPQGDILKAVTEIVAKLRAGGLSPEEEAFNLKMLIHLGPQMELHRVAASDRPPDEAGGRGRCGRHARRLGGRDAGNLPQGL